MTCETFRRSIGPAIGIAVLVLIFGRAATAEDGYRLWLRYAPVADASKRADYERGISRIIVEGDSPTLRVIRDELEHGIADMLGRKIPGTDVAGPAVVVGTPTSSRIVAGLAWDAELAKLGSDGYLIRSTKVSGQTATVIASRGESGALYGAFHFLRLLQTNKPIGSLDVKEHPRYARRLLNHWDNLDGTIERGYAGRSLWRWDELPQRIDPRYVDYARANASIGINGAVLNNVNANPIFLTADYLRKAAALAKAFRPYGIRVCLSANFDAPRSLGKLSTADPLDAGVIAWWKAKADEIYQLIPDFGGFLVKANSEGQPGPQGYGRTHADGANCLADALAPHGGVVFWRAFVYEDSVDPDRAKRAYKEFVPLDGKFRPNVIVQVKNGAIDFQPREPFHPLFGALRHTHVAAELQIAPEYFGKHRHMVFFAPMWKAFFDADTYARGEGSTVSKMIAGGVAGVANTGSDRNWTAHDFSQANWYAFGRLAWNPDLAAADIADEWIRMTFSNAPRVVKSLKPLMLSSWETYVSYNAPLGLTHLQADERDGPDPGSTALHRADWNPPYYHRAAADGIGFDRSATGSDAVSQYASPLRERFGDVRTCPEMYLLWFHHVPWNHQLPSGRNVWEELCHSYDDGCRRAEQLRATWQSLKGDIDAERFDAVARRLDFQFSDARRWRDRALSYFQSVSGLPRPRTAESAEASRENH